MMDVMVNNLNASCLQQEVEWFGKVLELRMKVHASELPPCSVLEDLPPPDFGSADAPFADLIRHHSMDAADRLLLILGFLPHLKPDVLDPFFIRNRSLDRRFTEFGGVLGHAHGGFLPTGQTAIFLLAGDDVQLRLHFQYLFSPDYFLYEQNILKMSHQHAEEPLLSSLLVLSDEYLERLTTGRSYRPPYSHSFPAKMINTEYEWSDLILERKTRQDVEDIVVWAEHENVLMKDWRLSKRLKPGYRSLFYGPPGTGKTLTACLLGKSTGLDVYRIDLSKVVSKYIGETEKNLAELFNQAEHRDWILFFDEAESLFGKRTDTRSSNDRYANQQVGYLLQRIEDFPGIVILATNLKSHVDEAFSRRFQSMIHFPMPNAELRLQLWHENFVDKPFKLAPDIDLQALARDYELSGGSIVNVLRFACLKAVTRTAQDVQASDILDGIEKEFQKEGRYLKKRH